MKSKILSSEKIILKNTVYYPTMIVDGKRCSTLLFTYAELDIARKRAIKHNIQHKPWWKV